MSLNRATVGKLYEDREREEVTVEAMRLYAEATGALERWEARWSEGEQLALPLFAVRPLVSVLFGAIEDEEVGIELRRLVHGEQEMCFHEPLRRGDRVLARGEIESIEAKSTGEVLVLRQWLEREDGAVVVTARSVLFVRGDVSPRGGGASAEAKGSEAARSGAWIVEQTQVVDEDQSVRYARASGDMNPLHTDDAFARRAGLDARILHGLCTMAMSANVVIEALCEGEIERLERLRVRFARPVYMGDALTTHLYEAPGGGGVFELEVHNQRGEAVLTRGEVRVREKK